MTLPFLCTKKTVGGVSAVISKAFGMPSPAAAESLPASEGGVKNL